MRYLVLIFVLIMASCKVHEPVRILPVETRTEIRDRIITVELPSDSATVRALFECDSLNRVVLREMVEQKGLWASSQVQVQGGEIVVRYVYDPPPQDVHLRDSIITKEIAVPVPQPYEVNVLRWWQKALMWAGGFYLLFTAVSLLVRRK